MMKKFKYFLFLFLFFILPKNVSASGYFSINFDDVYSGLNNSRKQTLSDLVSRLDELIENYSVNYPQYPYYYSISFNWFNDYDSESETYDINDVLIQWWRLDTDGLERKLDRYLFSYYSNFNGEFGLFNNTYMGFTQLYLDDITESTLEDLDLNFTYQNYYNTKLGYNVKVGNGLLYVNDPTDPLSFKFYYPLYINKQYYFDNSSYSASSRVNIVYTCDDDVFTLDGSTRVPFVTVNDCHNIFEQVEEPTPPVTNEDLNQSLNDINDNIMDDNIDGASGTAGGFFSDFQSNDHGLSSIIFAPLRLIQNLNNYTCTPLRLTVPFVDYNFELPCYNEIYEESFPEFLQLWHLITFGIISYWILIHIFQIIKNAKDPNNDDLEVMDL